MAHKQYSRKLSPAELAVVNETYPMRHILRYRKEQVTERGKALHKRISEDPRVLAVAGLSLWHGGVGGKIWVPSLVSWFLWFSDRSGAVAAERALNDFLDGKDMPGLVSQ